MKPGCRNAGAFVLFGQVALLILSGSSGRAAPAHENRHRKNPLAALSSSIREVTQRVTPAVVQIIATGYSTGDDTEGRTSNQISRQRSSGSGVIVDSAGYIITNAHVVEGAITIKVMIGGATADRKVSNAPLTTTDARILGIDRESDLALLKVNAGRLTCLSFGDSDALSQGDLVLAVGSPMLFRNSLTMGVVSAPARPVNDDDPILYIQTDASINPGDSGGALVDSDGLLVGVNTFIVSKSGGNEGIGFAIPAKVVRNVYQQLRDNGVVARGAIGIFVQNISPELALGLDLPVRQGVLVSDVEPEGPCETAGLQRRDIVIALNGAPTESARQFNNAVFQAKAGDKIDLSIRRGPKKLVLTVVVKPRSAPDPSLAALISPTKSLIRRLGIYCVELSGEAADLLPGLRRHYGLIVAAKSREGQAQFVDLRPGDVIHAINNLPVSSVDALRERIDSLQSGDAVALQIERDERFEYVAFQIE